MNRTTPLSCRCGQLRLEVIGAPISSPECCCNSCREAATILEALPGAPPFREPTGTTRYVMQRKDRVRFLSGTEHLRAFRLTPESGSRRIVATCCNTPVCLELKGGHWLSLYGVLWPSGTLPPPDLRTMAGDLPDPGILPDDVPNLKGQSGMFFAKLLLAWAAMGFRVPKLSFEPGELRA